MLDMYTSECKLSIHSTNNHIQTFVHDLDTISSSETFTDYKIKSIDGIHITI